MKRQNNYKQLQFISSATLLEEADRFRIIRKSMISISVTFLCLLLWSAFVPLNEVAATTGQIQPAGKSYPVQHLEGGIIKNIYVHNDQYVKQGQPLVKMDPINAQAQLANDQTQQAGLVLDIIRLEAFLNNKKPDEIDWVSPVLKPEYDTQEEKNKIYDLIQNEQSQLAKENSKRLTQIAAQENQIAQDKEKVTNLNKKIELAKTQSELFSREMAMYEKLLAKHYVSEKDYLSEKRKMNQTIAEIADYESQKNTALEAIKESQAQLENIKAESEANTHQQLSETKSALMRVQENIKKLADQADRTIIRAEISGTVQGLEANNGSILSPRQKIMEIIPDNQELIIESKVHPKDIGHIKIGDRVIVKVFTYDYARYGGIEGKLISISPSTYQDPGTEKLYYKATIEMTQNYVGKDPKQNLIRPGMTVQASIITGKRSLLKYLLKPIHTTTENSFGER